MCTVVVYTSQTTPYLSARLGHTQFVAVTVPVWSREHCCPLTGWLRNLNSLGREGNTTERELIVNTAVRMDQTPFDITNHSDLSSFAEESEGSLGTLELASLLVRTVTVVLTLLGGILLVGKILRRRRGSSTEASLVIAIQFIWQVRPLLSPQ